MKIKWRCKKCESVQISDSKERHCMDYCKCKESAIDLEQHYMRSMGVPEIIERTDDTSWTENFSIELNKDN